MSRYYHYRANGYGDLAGRLEYSANLGLTSGERGLEALKLMASGGGLSDIESLKKAAHVGQLAKDIGMKSLGALPTSDSIPISTIEGNEKAWNKKRTKSPAQKFVFILITKKGVQSK